MSDLARRLDRLEAVGQPAQPTYCPLTTEQVEVEARALLAAEQAYLKAIEEGREETALEEAEAAYLGASPVTNRRCSDDDVGRVIGAIEAIWLRERAQ
jgi:hypothetical protein